MIAFTEERKQSWEGRKESFLKSSCKAEGCECHLAKLAKASPPALGHSVQEHHHFSEDALVSLEALTIFFKSDYSLGLEVMIIHSLKNQILSCSHTNIKSTGTFKALAQRYEYTVWSYEYTVLFPAPNTV